MSHSSEIRQVFNKFRLVQNEIRVQKHTFSKIKIVRFLLIFTFISVVILTLFDSNDVYTIQRGTDPSFIQNRFQPSTWEPNGLLRIAVVIGTRPELIKLLKLINISKLNHTSLDIRVVNTAQHSGMLSNMLIETGVEPDVTFPERREKTLTGTTSELYHYFDVLLTSWNPHVVLVQGDTTTAYIAAHSAFLRGIHVGHIEAGLRTYHGGLPFPEEINRRSLSMLCSLCFAPTQLAVDALMGEGIQADRVFLTGNTVVDSLQLLLSQTSKEPNVDLRYVSGPVLTNVTSELIARKQHIVLWTTHRRETVMLGLKGIVSSLSKLLQKHPSVTFIVPLHPNPKVQHAYQHLNGSYPNLYLTKPLSYHQLVSTLQRITLVATDSGGLQEEAFTCKLPVVVLRERTERYEGVLAGGAILAGTREERVYNTIDTILSDSSRYRNMHDRANSSVFGDGHASSRILKIITSKKEMLLKDDAYSYLNFNQLYASRLLPIAQTAFKETVTQAQPFDRNNGKLSVILTGYKRPPHVLEKQLKVLETSTVKPDHIIFFQNEEHVDFSAVLHNFPRVKHVHFKNLNSKFHGRFLLPLLLDSEFTAIVDDDTVSGKRWLEVALDYVKKHRVLVGNSGRKVLHNELDSGVYQYGKDSSVSGRISHHNVDFVGHWWIFRTEWIHTLWSRPTSTLWTGEDIDFSSKLKMFLGVDSVVLDVSNNDMNPETQYGHSQHFASSKDPESMTVRRNLVRRRIAEGWIPIDFE